MISFGSEHQLQRLDRYEKLPMKAFLCGHCGATLDILDDPTVTSAKCPFCGASTPLPEAILELRAPSPSLVSSPAGASQSARVMMILAGVSAMLMLGVGIAVAQLRTAPQQDPPVVPPLPVAPPPSVVAEPSATPSKVEDRHTAGEERTSERMKELHANGCKDVILPPSQVSGEQTLDTKFVMNGRCVTVLAMSGVPENELTLSMKTPLGEPVATPPKGSSIELSICPKMPGAHPTKIVPRTTDTYTVAAIECPAPAKKKTP